MLHKTFELLETKAEGNSGEFTAIVSTFGNVDRVGDRIMPGAWTKTLTKWMKSGDPVPLILAHQWEDPFAHVGVARPEDIRQTAKGLQVKGRLDIDDNPVAKQVYKLMKRRSLKEFSIGYSVPVGGEKIAEDGVNEITEIDLAECGPCLKGIDPKTELQGVKAALGVEDPPRDAQTLRKEGDQAARELTESQLPEIDPIPEPEPAPVVEPKAEEPVEPPADAATLRKEGERVALDLERERNDERIEALPALASADVVEPAPVVKAEPDPPRDAATLRKEAERIALAIERGIADEQIRGLPPLPEPDPPPPAPDVITELQEVKSQLAELREALSKPPAPDPAELRKEAARVEREVQQTQLPKVPELWTPEPEPQIDVGKELQEVKALLAETRGQLEDLKAATEATDQEPHQARSVDPQRKQADALALEVASGGRGLHKPPPTVTPEKPEPALTLKELRQRTRDEMLGVLSGRPIE